ncbi:BapA/Bap/LapF family large adhesin [Klebsiella sp. RIT-PI-d]|uniref:BapA/Bap/LapF family large adhesin n=1 Tax=Klebsiella sp. RIT-PI-d TaxID=1681196 RepID=UPI003A0FE4EB
MDTTAPDVPIIVSITDDIAPITGIVGNGAATNDARPTLNGTGEAGATLRILDNGVQIGTTTVATDGSWSFTPGINLAQGTHNLSATATDAAGNTGGASALYSVIVDTLAPPAPQATLSADGGAIGGTAEAGSTVIVTLPGNVQLTTTASASGAWSISLSDRQTEGEAIAVTARDSAGNVSPATTLTAPVLPLSASDNVTELDLTTDATVTTENYTDYGVLLIGALGNNATVLGNDTAQVTFTVAQGGRADLSIDSAATGIVLSLLNTQQIAVQRLDPTSNAWVTVADSSQPQFADLLTLNGSSVNFTLDGLTGGTYRVLSYNSNLLATGSFTSLNVSVVQTSAGTLNGETVHVGNVIQDIDPVSGGDSAPNGTVVSQVSNASGQTVTVGAGGAIIDGLYGTLTINADGSYRYALTSTSPTVLGRTESFTYTITHNGVSDSAQLVVALGAGTAGSTVTAVDNTATLTYETQVEIVNNGPSSQSSFSVVGIALGNVLNANILNNITNPIVFDVEEGSTRTLTLQSSAGGVALLSTFDLYVYRFNDAIQQFEQYRVEPGWLRVPLLGGQSGQLTLTLPGGEYLFLLNNASGVTALTGYTLNILQDRVYNVESLTATTSGNVLDNDVAPAGTLVTEVNGVAVGAGGATITGSHGTLTIDQAGNYSYTLRSGVGADSINAPDSFIYTVRTPDGSTDSASLNIIATPLPVNAVDDVSPLMTFTTLQDTTAFADNSVGSATWTSSLISRTSGTGSGIIEVAAGTAVKDAVLNFTVASGLALGGLTVNWTLYDGATAVRTGSFGGGALLGNAIAVSLGGLELHSGNYTLSYTGSIGALSVGNITITPRITGTAWDLDNFETSGVHTINGNIYDGSDAAGVVDQLSTVDTRLTITGFNGSTVTLDPFTSNGASGTVQGHYGTLTIASDGAYSYALRPGVATASMTTRETFNYTLNDQNGHTDNATLTIDMAPQFVSTAQNDTVIGTAYADTLIYQLLNTTSATGGNGNDTWSNFSLAQGDKIDIGDLLVGWNGDQATLGNYLTVTTSGNNITIAIDRDGAGTTYQSTNLVTLENVQTNLEELIQQNHIIT